MKCNKKEYAYTRQRRENSDHVIFLEPDDCNAEFLIKIRGSVSRGDTTNNRDHVWRRVTEEALKVAVNFFDGK